MNKYKDYYNKDPLAWFQFDDEYIILVFENKLPDAIKPFITCVETHKLCLDDMNTESFPDNMLSYLICVERVSWSENNLLDENGYKYINKLNSKINIKWFKDGKTYPYRRER